MVVVKNSDTGAKHTAGADADAVMAANHALPVHVCTFTDVKGTIAMSLDVDTRSQFDIPAKTALRPAIKPD